MKIIKQRQCVEYSAEGEDTLGERKQDVLFFLSLCKFSVCSAELPRSLLVISSNNSEVALRQSCSGIWGSHYRGSMGKSLLS